MMCEMTREKIHHWLDGARGGTLPPDLAEHLRSCGECRSFVSRWNGIELQLQSIREEIRPSSLDFSTAVRYRLEQPRPRFALRLPVYVPRVGLAGSAALAVVIALLYVLLSGTIRLPINWSPERAGNSAANIPPARMR